MKDFSQGFKVSNYNQTKWLEGSDILALELAAWQACNI